MQFKYIFFIPMIYIKPRLVVYLERNSLFNFDKTEHDYVKIVTDSPALSISFQNNIADWDIFTVLETTQTTTAGGDEKKTRIYS